MTDYSSDHSVVDPDYNPDPENEDVSKTCVVDTRLAAPKTTKIRSKFQEFYEFKSTNLGNSKIAVCLLCKNKKLYVELQVKGGTTTTLKRHLQRKHNKEFCSTFTDASKTFSHPGTSIDSTQKTLPEMFQTKELLSLKNKEIDNSVIVDWVAKKYLPFSFFDDDASRSFFHQLCPGFSLPGRKQLKRMVLERYDELKNVVMQILENNSSNISFTVDGWTAINRKSYYGITAHFIDNNWELQSFVIDFVPSYGEHTGKDIAKLFFETVKSYGIEQKIQGITVDNASANTSFMKELSILLPTFDSINQHFRCMAHVLNLAVQDLFRTLNLSPQLDEEYEDEDENENNSDFEEENTSELNLNCIERIRIVFKKIRKSEILSQRLKSACQTVGVPSELSPVLDSPTRWNSTYNMIEVAFKLKRGLLCLCESDPTLKQFTINENEWLILEKMCKFLKMFKRVTDKLGGDKYVTLPSVIVCINFLLDKIEEEIKQLDEKEDRSTVDEQLLLAYQSSRNKILKHYRLTNWLYCAVLVLDPRHKVELFDRTSWGKNLKKESLHFFQNRYKQYVKQESDLCPPLPESSEDSDDDFGVSKLYQCKRRKDDKSDEDELANYLSQPRCKGEENMIVWWKMNKEKFPILSKMAKDLFSVTATSIPSERLFSKAGLVLRKQRNRLNHESAKSLLCLNSWVEKSVLNLNTNQ